MIRRPVQIAVDSSDSKLYAICNDGTIWQFDSYARWVEMPMIPQDESKDEVPRVVGKLKEVENWAERTAMSSSDVRSKLGRFVLDMLRNGVKPKQ
jgi:hypothetical protein